MHVLRVGGVLIGTGIGAAAIASVEPGGGGFRDGVLGKNSASGVHEAHGFERLVVDQLADYRAVVAHSAHLIQGISRGGGKSVEGAGCCFGGVQQGGGQEKGNDYYNDYRNDGKGTDGRNRTGKVHWNSILGCDFSPRIHRQNSRGR